jgi:hypothetical protein
MQSRQKSIAPTIFRVLSHIDAHAPLPLLGLAAGALAGAAYTLESASHMLLPARTDLYIVGLMLAAIGAAAGWLVGVMVRAPLAGGSGPDKESLPDGGGPVEEAPVKPPLAPDRG